MEEKRSDLPLIGFTVWFNNLGETYPLVNVAKKYIDLGGQAIFFGYGKKYQDLAKNIGCKVITFPEYRSEKASNNINRRVKEYNENQIPMENFLLNIIDDDNYQYDINNINNEIKTFKEYNVKLVVTGFNYRSNISARVAKIPLVYIISGAGISLYYKQNLAKFPDNYENFFTRLVPRFMKNRIANWFILNNKSLVKQYDKLAQKFNTPKIKHYLDLFLGDYTFVVEDIEFSGITPCDNFYVKNFVGPIFQEEIATNNEDSIEFSIKKHLERPGKSILVSLGSSVTKKLLLEILHAFEKTDINVIAVYAPIFKKNEVPTFKDNILLVPHVPSIKKLNELVDVAIIHGGRGTIYTAAYAGKPVIGIPMMIEQQCNIDNLIRRGSAIRLSKKYFNSKDLLNAVDNIFTEYDTFFNNAQLLKKKMHEPKGAENIVKRLLEIIEENKV